MRGSSYSSKWKHVAVNLSPSTNLQKILRHQSSRLVPSWSLKSQKNMVKQIGSWILFTCSPSNQALYGIVVLRPSSFASLCTRVRLPVKGITESWSPLQSENEKHEILLVPENHWMCSTMMDFRDELPVNQHRDSRLHKWTHNRNCWYLQVK